jgi:hypothetical protein
VASFIRSGKPHHINGATSTIVEEWETPGKTNQFDFQNTHPSVDIELFFTLEAAMAGAGHGFIVPAQSGYYLEVELMSFWTLSAAAGSFRAILTTHP